MFNVCSESSLSDQLCCPDTLEIAWRKVRANKGAPGSDGVGIQQFEMKLRKHLRQLGRELAEERYYPLPIRKFIVRKPDGGTRELAVLALKDRIVQRAICDLITPIYEAKFLDCSFAFRPNRGVPHAIARVAAIRAEGYQWAVRADIEKFFDRMDSQILTRFLRASIKEPMILRLIQMWLDLGGITQPPKLPAWATHIQDAAQSLGEGAEKLAQRLLYQAPRLEGYSQLRNAPIAEEWIDDEAELADGFRSRAKKEALMNLGRDGLMLLLANSKVLGRCLAVKNFYVIAPIVVGTLAAPAVAGMVQDRLNRPRTLGIVQGSPLSPLLANIYLHSFDKAMTRAGIRLVRYADDLILLCRSEDRAKWALGQAQKRLGSLRLELNPKKTRIAAFDDGVEFLGHIFDRDGCYRPIPDSRTKIIQDGMRRSLKKGVEHASRAGQTLNRTGEYLAARIGGRLSAARSPNNDDDAFEASKRLSEP